MQHKYLFLVAGSSQCLPKMHQFSITIYVFFSARAKHSKIKKNKKQAAAAIASSTPQLMPNICVCNELRSGTKKNKESNKQQPRASKATLMSMHKKKREMQH